MEVNVAKQSRSRSEWAKYCAAWAASGESRRAFAKRHGLNPRTFSWWCTELRHELATVETPIPSSGFIEVVAARPQHDIGQASTTTSGVVVRVGEVVVDFGAALPPAWWVAEVAGRC
jgi:hypothetical protein